MDYHMEYHMDYHMDYHMEYHSNPATGFSATPSHKVSIKEPEAPERIY